MGVFRQGPAIQLPRPSLIAQQFVPAAPPLFSNRLTPQRREPGLFEVLQDQIAATQSVAAGTDVAGGASVRAQVTETRLLWTQSPPNTAVSYVERYVPPAPTVRVPDSKPWNTLAAVEIAAPWITFTPTTTYLAPSALPRIQARDDRTGQIESPQLATFYVERFVPPTQVARYQLGPRFETMLPFELAVSWITFVASTPDNPSGKPPVLQLQAPDTSLRWVRTERFASLQYVERFVPPKQVARNPVVREHAYVLPFENAAPWITFVAGRPSRGLTIPAVQAPDIRLHWLKAQNLASLLYIERFVPPAVIARNPYQRPWAYRQWPVDAVTWITYVAPVVESPIRAKSKRNPIHHERRVSIVHQDDRPVIVSKSRRSTIT